MSAEAPSIYTAEFYERHLTGSAFSAKRILARLFEIHPVSSILDVGCGRGAWLRAARELGVTECLGLDGDYVERTELLVDPDEFRAADLRLPLSLERRFDLTISIEVAEHLPFERASSFVLDLTATSDVVLFSAATPYQGGADHVNEQWPEFWAILFRQHGFRCFDPFRESAWDDRLVEPWYAQNVLLFVREGAELTSRLATHAADDRVLSRIHPELILHNATRARPHALAALDDEIHDWHALVDAYRSGSSDLPRLLTIESRGGPVGGFPLSRTEYRSSFEVAQERLEVERRVVALETNIAAVERRAAEETRRWTTERTRLVESFAEVLARELARSPTAPPAAEPAAGVESPLRAQGASSDRGWKKRIAAAAPKRLSGVFRRMRIAADVRYLRESGEFDEEFYRRTNADVVSAGFDPVEHYVQFGVREGRLPRADFDPRSIGKLKANEFPRNPFVIHLQRQASRKSDAGTAPGWFTPSPLEDVLTRSTDPVRYGAQELGTSVCFPGSLVLKDDPSKYEAQTGLIVERFIDGGLDGPPRSWVAQFGPREQIAERIASRVPDPTVDASSRDASYSIITPFYDHAEYFVVCARSVARLLAHDFEVARKRRIEWIIVNDDPRRSADELEAMLPQEVRAYARVLSDGVNRGIAARLNQGIEASKHEWLLFLDCDDTIVPRALDVLEHYSAAFPRCRYISGSMIDIDTHDREMRRRHRKGPAARLFEEGMVLGHLVSVRRDLFRAIGNFDPRFSGCQDFEFALRAALVEPLLQIPEHLYAYRWHGSSQSVNHAMRQHRIAEAVRRSIATQLVDERWPDRSVAPVAMPRAPRGICLVRTQGTRLELLAETLASVANQSVAMTACVVVHGDSETFAMVRRFVARIGVEPVVLHAPDTTRRRGYPLNVALDHVEANADRYDFFSFLDDDDIYYPTFAERLSAALDYSGADVAFATTNARARDGRVSAMYPPIPTACLAITNFIPNNAYVVRIGVLARSHIRFPEDIDYLEDWDFLLSLLDVGCRFRAHAETLSEFRLIGDGNTTERRDSEHFQQCSLRLRARGLLLANRLGAGEFYRSVLEFEPHSRSNFTTQERDLLLQAGHAFGAISTNRRN